MGKPLAHLREYVTILRMLLWEGAADFSGDYFTDHYTNDWGRALNFEGPSGAREFFIKYQDRVLFGKYSGSEIKIDGEEYLIIREDEVLAVLDSK